MWVAVGRATRPPALAGAAHYLEHLLFKGTARRTAAQIAEEIDAVGGELNAFTAKEHTCYYAHVLDADLPLAVDLVSDVVIDAMLAPPDVEIERGVVLEEIAMRDDDPEDLLHDVFCAALFGDHPLGRPVLGSEESIRGDGPGHRCTRSTGGTTPAADGGRRRRATWHARAGRRARRRRRSAGRTGAARAGVPPRPNGPAAPARLGCAAGQTTPSRRT